MQWAPIMRCTILALSAANPSVAPALTKFRRIGLIHRMQHVLSTRGPPRVVGLGRTLPLQVCASCYGPDMCLECTGYPSALPICDQTLYSMNECCPVGGQQLLVGYAAFRSALENITGGVTRGFEAAPAGFPPGLYLHKLHLTAQFSKCDLV